MIRILDAKSLSPEEIFARKQPTAMVEAPVAEIIKTVRAEGDAALYRYAREFDRVELSSILVSEEEKREAMASLDKDLMTVLEKAAENIRAYHSCQIREGFRLEKEGVILGQRVLPMEKVGVYVPGGTAAYPSTVLMDTIPAKLAGVKEIVMVSPPGKDGKIKPEILAAALVAGVDTICKVGGAQAVAALAYGTESIPRVDKIVGPGNAFVAEAKKQVFGQVAIDMIAGPSEILVLADESAEPACVAADMLSQAEHDKLASAVLVTDSPALAKAVQAELEKQLSLLEREDVARASIDNNGKIIVTEDLPSALDTANTIAPEHLELYVKEPFAWLDKVKNAGSVFLGGSCPEAVGDYFAGPNHTLPTGGTARFSSPLSVDDFVRKSQYLYYTPEALAAAAEDIALFARAEGLTGHARSVLIRKEVQK